MVDTSGVRLTTYRSPEEFLTMKPVCHDELRKIRNGGPISNTETNGKNLVDRTRHERMIGEK